MNFHFFDIDIKNVPKFIEHDFINVNQVQQVSKFRSGVGHDASFDGEDCRSMRHYFGFLGMGGQTVESKLAYKYDNYAPVSGRIMSISGGKSGNGTWQINIRPDNPAASGFEVRIDNLVPEEGLHNLSHVIAGQKIGQSLGMAEITIAYHYLFNDHGFSYFQLMPDDLFAKYQVAATSKPLVRNDMVITKEYRDAHPLQCDTTSGRFFIPSAETESDYNNVYFHGYSPKIETKKDDIKKNE